MLLRLLLLSALFIGCSVKQPTAKEVNFKIKELSALLRELHPKVSSVEAYSLAQSSVFYSQRLAEKYEVVSSPWIQNTLVNVGIKKRGLCYEWTEDLLGHLSQKNYQTLDLHAIGANIGYLNEHNALSVSARGEGMEKSIVLDAWRNSGNLYFIKIMSDKNYDWVERVGLYN